MRIPHPRAASLLVVFSLTLPSLGAAACERDTALATIRADCSFGNQNIYFQVACQDLYRFSAMADNVDVGARSALKDLQANVEAAKAKPIPDQPTAWGRTRGIAVAGIETANFHLSAAQLVLSKLISSKQAALDKLKELKARNQEDQATLEVLREGKGWRNDAESQALRQQRIQEFTARVQAQAKVQQKIQEGLQREDASEKKLRTLRGELAAFKSGSTKELAGLPHDDDKAVAKQEDARTEKLSKDDMTLYDSIRMNCFQNNGVYAGCRTFLQSAGLFGTVTAFGRVWAMVRWAAWQAIKAAYNDYYADKSMLQLLRCGESKAFPVIDMVSDSDLGIPPVVPGL